MNRRAFVSLLSAAVSTSRGWTKAAGDLIDTSTQTASKIKYIREDIPAFEIPPYRGETYDDLVPDTLDIAERAKLGINVLTSITDPAADYQIYWAVGLFRNPPVMEHQFDDYDVQVVEGFLEALPLLRTATGSGANGDVDRVWMTNFLRCIGPDGLFYLPLLGGPWERPKGTGGGRVWRPDGSTAPLGDASVTQISSSQLAARCLGTLTLYYRRDGNPLWSETAARMIRRLSELAISSGDYCYFAENSVEPNARIGADAQMPLGLDAIELNGRLAQGLSQCYKATGFEPALDLARRLALYFRRHSGTYDERGRFLWADSDRSSLGWGYNAKYEVIGGHGHGRSIGLLSLLEYGAAAGDRDTMQFVKASFEWAKSQQGSPFGVSTLVGWFPEWYYPEYPSCEGCMAADMVALAIKLSVAKVGDYWDDVDRWVRNDFAEQQLTSTDWIYRMAEHQPKRAIPPHAVAEHMAERNIGAFAGWSSGNDWVVNAGIMHCCTGNATRTLYYIWEHTLQNDAGTLTLNLLLNRASAWTDVYSYLPYNGRVDLKMKTPGRSVLVRAPEWVNSGSPDIVCTVDGAPRQLHWEGRYVELGPAQKGATVVVTFPVSERRVVERIGPEKYTIVLRGNTVISIDPPGKNGPLYANREQYSSGQVKWVKLNRFAPENPIAW